MGISKTVSLGKSVEIHETARVWDFAYLGDFAQIGRNVIIGRFAYIGSGVKVGNDCKIQNNSLIYEPAEIESGVFIGPGVIFTNDKFPRAVNSDFSQKTKKDWDQVGIYVKQGASIGANAVCVAPINIGRWSLIGSGSVVTRDVPDFALMAGNPAIQIGWVGKNGQRLVRKSENSNIFICPKTKAEYELVDKILVELVS